MTDFRDARAVFLFKDMHHRPSSPQTLFKNTCMPQQKDSDSQALMLVCNVVVVIVSRYEAGLLVGHEHDNQTVTSVIGCLD